MSKWVWTLYVAFVKSNLDMYFDFENLITELYRTVLVFLGRHHCWKWYYLHVINLHNVHLFNYPFCFVARRWGFYEKVQNNIDQVAVRQVRMKLHSVIQVLRTLIRVLLQSVLSTTERLQPTLTLNLERRDWTLNQNRMLCELDVVN